MTKRALALQNKAGEQIRKGRISPALRSAIYLLVTESLTQREAAKRVGYQEHSLQVALQKPHVRALLADVKRAHREGATFQAWGVVKGLMTSAQSEKVRLEASRTVLQAGGELAAPEDKVEKSPAPLIQFVRNEFYEGVCLVSDGGVVRVEEADRVGPAIATRSPGVGRD